MVQITVTRDFDGGGIETRIITYNQMGYKHWGYAMNVPEFVEDSFIGASMFGWDAPIADVAHKWVANQEIE